MSPMSDRGPEQDRELERERARAGVSLRFEDVAQDGRLVLEAIPNALGATAWKGILARDPAAQALLRAGIVPILSRIVMEGYAGPISSSVAVEAEGSCRFVRVEDRIALDMRAELFAGSVRIASIFAEHILTRPFAAENARRVRAQDWSSTAPAGAPPITVSRPPLAPAESLLAVPSGVALEPDVRPDAAPLTFGVVHTDSNQHVNSLAYLRIFEEAALRRFAALGRSAIVLGRGIDIAYRKPCFAGQTVRVWLRAFEQDGRPGVVAVLVDALADPLADALADPLADGRATGGARPYTYARMTFE
jgi:hypothetical protein